MRGYVHRTRVLSVFFYEGFCPAYLYSSYDMVSKLVYSTLNEF